MTFMDSSILRLDQLSLHKEMQALYYYKRSALFILAWTKETHL